MSLRFEEPTILYGGSFDPVHDGHLHVAKHALAAVKDAKQLVFIPAAASPGKTKALASPEQRLAWLRLAAEPLGFGVWDCEVRRGGESFTVRTLEEAGAPRDRLYWLLGADAYESFPRWREPARIRQLCRLLVVNRPGREISPQSPQDLLVTIPPHPASSSEIRAQLASGGDGKPWVPAPVRAALESLLPGGSPYVRN